jgi:hypothetical protein
LSASVRGRRPFLVVEEPSSSSDLFTGPEDIFETVVKTINNPVYGIAIIDALQIRY